MTATDEVFMRAALLCSLLLGAAACGSDDAASPVDAAADGATDPDGGSGGPGLGSLRAVEERWINPETGELSSTSRFDGWYFDGPQPPWHREVARSGACVLRRYTPAFCDPACALGTLCVDTDVCLAPPRFESAGTLTVTGLTVPITLASTTGYYQHTDGLPTDLFTDSATVTATLAGAVVPAHTLVARGVPPLVAAIGNFRTLTPGQDHTITWTPAGGDALVRLLFNSNNIGHGAPYFGIIDCDVPDADGQITVAAALVDGFPETGPWQVCAGSDCPPSTLTRYHRATATTTAGTAELIVGSQLSFGVDHSLE